MKPSTKSEWFELPSPLGEPDYPWPEHNGSYFIERVVNRSGETIWFGLAVNWLKKPDGPWTVLSTNDNAKPLVKYLPENVYGEDRTYWKECEMPIYEKMYQEL